MMEDIDIIKFNKERLENSKKRVKEFIDRDMFSHALSEVGSAIGYSTAILYLEHEKGKRTSKEEESK